MEITVLGSGLVGNAIVRDLAQEDRYKITAVDLNQQVLDKLKAEVPVTIKGQTVKPIDVTSKLIFDHWRVGEEEEDLTIMQVIIDGQKGDKKLRYTYDMLDKYDRKTQMNSMARTTGYTCTIVARQVIGGLFYQKGICPPEFIGRTKGCYENLLTECESRNIHLNETIIEL